MDEAILIINYYLFTIAKQQLGAKSELGGSVDGPKVQRSVRSNQYSLIAN